MCMRKKCTPEQRHNNRTTVQELEANRNKHTEKEKWH